MFYWGISHLYIVFKLERDVSLSFEKATNKKYMYFLRDIFRFVTGTYLSPYFEGGDYYFQIRKFLYISAEIMIRI